MATLLVLYKYLKHPALGLLLADGAPTARHLPTLYRLILTPGNEKPVWWMAGKFLIGCIDLNMDIHFRGRRNQEVK